MKKLQQWMVAAAVALALSACFPKKMPGTDIDDTPENRNIVQVLESYRKAMERRDAEALAALASPNFHDDGGSADPADDLRYADLLPTLKTRVSKLADIRLDLDIRRIALGEDRKTATVTYTYTTSFSVVGGAAKPKTETDIKQMVLERAPGKPWQLLSGI